ncbi:MAG: InlB B-repeat-containing protein [Clostridium sp.]
MREPTRTGYIFKGWSTSSTATKASYQPGDNYTSNSNVTLYAVWEKIQYNISYDANGGSGAPSDQSKYYDFDNYIKKRQTDKKRLSI